MTVAFGLVGLVGLTLVTVAMSLTGVVLIRFPLVVSTAGMILALVFFAVVAGRECSGECDLAGHEVLLVVFAEVGLSQPTVKAASAAQVDEIVEEFHELPMVDVTLVAEGVCRDAALVLGARVVD